MVQQSSNDLAKVQDTLMGMYDYIDGKTPCPYQTPDEWRKKLMAEAMVALRILRARMALDTRMANLSQSDSPSETDQASPRSNDTPQPRQQTETAPLPDSSKADHVKDTSREDEKAEIAKRKQAEQLEKRRSLRDAILRLKEKQGKV